MLKCEKMCLRINEIHSMCVVLEIIAIRNKAENQSLGMGEDARAKTIKIFIKAICSRFGKIRC
jgi:hypothetical protein